MIKQKIPNRIFVMPSFNGFDLDQQVVYVTLHGSRAYGTSTASSDSDFKGFFIAPLDYYLGIGKTVEQVESRRSKQDAVVYEVRKFFDLASNCNPSILEVLFVDKSDRQIFVGQKMEGWIDTLRLNCLTRRAKHTFGGYAIAQLKKIKSHRAWLLNPPKKKPEREDFKLSPVPKIPVSQLEAVQAEIVKQMEKWNVDLSSLEFFKRAELQDAISVSMAERQILQDAQWESAARSLGMSENFIEHAARERSYKTACAEWSSYRNWLENRNPERAALEAKYGYDTKHAMHLVRLLRMGKEILDGKGCIVRRPDNNELVAICCGQWSYDQLMVYVEQAQKDLDLAHAQSKLPNSPNLKVISDVVQEMITLFHFNPEGF